MEHSFQINLRGIIDLLSNHLYSTPDTFVRELLQNAVDAITARRALEDGFQPGIQVELIEAGDHPTLVFEDNGIGLTEEEVHRFLATIGESSKRMAGGNGPRDFIGQFGIGLLSCFVVADEIAVVTRSARANQPAVEWKGRANGKYSLTLSSGAHPPGTKVFLRCRPEAREYFTWDFITDRVRHYGGLLQVPLFGLRNGHSAKLNADEAPWQRRFESRHAESAALQSFGEAVFGTRFLDCIPLRSRAGGVEGVAYVLPFSASISGRQKHRVYLKNMLLTESADNLLPDWAFFVRCVVNAKDLRPTASREGFYEDSKLVRTRDELGTGLKDWLVSLAKENPEQLRRLIMVHYRSFKALATEDDEFFAVIADFLPFETSHGTLSLGELRRNERAIRYTSSVDEFRQISSVAAAQGYCVVNAGYTYDAELLERARTLLPDTDVEVVGPGEVIQSFEDLTPEDRDAAFDFLREVDAALRPFKTSGDLRCFQPADVPALYSLSSDGQFRRSVETTREVSNELWQGLLDNISGSGREGSVAELTLNWNNLLVKKLSSLKDRRRLQLSIQMLYVQALLLGHHPLRAAEMTLLNEGLIGLIDAGLSPPPL